MVRKAHPTIYSILLLKWNDTFSLSSNSSVRLRTNSHRANELFWQLYYQIPNEIFIPVSEYESNDEYDSGVLIWLEA